MKTKLLKKLRKRAKVYICIQFDHTTKHFEVYKRTPTYWGDIKDVLFKTKSEDKAMLKLYEHRRHYILGKLPPYSCFHKKAKRVDKINERLAEL